MTATPRTPRATAQRARRAAPAAVRQRALLLDGHSLCYRAFYAIRELSTSTGQPTNAVYGFLSMLQALVDRQHPDYLAVAFDLPKPTFRHERFKDYKVHRQPMPDLLIEQLPVIREALEALRIPIFTCEGYEADDVLAALTRQLAADDLEVYVVTGDKDALQLVGPHVRVLAPKPHEMLYDAPAVEERLGVPPAQVTDVMALMGDATDNIPAVPGIGPKTAVALIRQFGSLEAVLAQLPSIENVRVRESLAAHASQARMAKELATMDAQAPVSVTREAIACRKPDVARLREFYRRLEFKGLLKRLALEESDAPVDEASTVPTADAALIVAARQAVTVALVALPSATAGQLGGVVLAWDGGTCHAPLATAADWRLLAPVLSNTTQLRVVHDYKSLLSAAVRAQASLDGPIFDTLLAAYLLNPAHTRPSIEDIAAQYLEQTVLWESAPLAERTPAQVAAVAVAAGQALLALAPRLQEELAARSLDELYKTVELPLSEVLAAMERRGIAVDLTALRELGQSMEQELTQVTGRINELAGEPFNLNSPKQLAHVLFDVLKLPVVKRTKTGPSTDAETLTKLADQHPLPAQLISYRELSKLKSTYVDALPTLVDPATQRLHTTFHQAVTATGRLSSSDPNLQNIPVRSELGRRIRRAFVPGTRGWLLLSADYSQIELRVLAHLSGDAALRQAFAEGHDVHRFTASLIYGVPEAEVTSEMRNAAKTVNFGVIYGMQAHGLSRELHIGVPEAQAFIDAYFLRYPGVRRYTDEQVTKAKRDGYVTTILGRRRYIPELRSQQGSIRQFGERTAVNAPIQGSAADLIKLAMITIHRVLREERLAAQMLLQVHDDLLFELPTDERDALAQLVRRHMAGALQLDVPLEVTLKSGPNWADLAPLS